MSLRTALRRRLPARSAEAAREPAAPQVPEVLVGRAAVLLDALLRTDTDGAPDPDVVADGATVAALVAALAPFDAERAWLMLATLDARLPSSDEVRTALRLAGTDGLEAAVRATLLRAASAADTGLAVRVVRDAVLVDVHHTAQAAFVTGIQRVTRECVRRWAQTEEVLLVGWHADLDALRMLTPAESDRACRGGDPVPDPPPGPVVVPVGCRYVLPELATESARTAALKALAECSDNSLAVIGYDLVPITVSETTVPGMPATFARSLAAARHATTIAAISESAATEYRGWAEMLRGIGLPGPRIETCALPTESHTPTPDQLAEAADQLLIGQLPMILVVGNHEPRKNHLAVLHAAEVLWREGQRFSLTFVGGLSWAGEEFTEVVDRLREAGRPLQTVAAASDGLLASAYRLARFTVFPSLNEGFGLPIVESLAAGTPVVTSRFGAMAEIGSGGGAVLVDSRDDAAIADAMRLLLTDDDEVARLSAEALARPGRSWDTYAAEAWSILTDQHF